MTHHADTRLAADVHAYVAETAPILAFRLDAERRVRSANQYARQILGADVEGRAFASLMPEFVAAPEFDALAASPAMITLATASGMPESYSFRFYAQADDTVLALGSPDLHAAARLQTMLLDLNQTLNNRTRQLHQANAELADLNRLKNQFLGMAAHDLRRGINVILIYNEFVLSEAGPQLSGAHQDFLRTGLTAAADMRRLIDGFLDLAVIESGKLQLDRQTLAASDIVSAALPMARLAVARRQLTLVVDVDASARTLMADAGKLQQVILNLIDNAARYSQPGQRIGLSAHWRGESLVIAVRDDGAGIVPAQQARLFQPFERGEPGSSAEASHAGLGLAIARAVVEAHQGRIWVDSQPGQGSTFSFSLPAVAS